MKSILGALRATSRRLDRATRRRWQLLVPLALLSTVAEMACTVAVVGVLDLLGPAGSAHQSRLLSRFHLPALHLNGARNGAFICFGAAGLYVIRGALRLVEIHRRYQAGCSSTAQISRSLFDEYLRAPYSWHLGQNPHELLHKLTFAAQHVCQQFLASLFGATVEACTSLALLAVLTLTIPSDLLLLCAVVTLLLGCLMLLTQQRLRHLGTIWNQVEARVTSRVSETLTSLKEIRMMGLDELARAEVGEAWTELAQTQTLRGTLGGIPRVVLEIFFMAGGFAAAGVCCWWNVPLTELLPALGLYVYVIARVSPSISSFIYHIGEVRYCTEALLTVWRDWVQLEQVREGAERDPDRIGPSGPVELSDVSFTYPGRTEPALRDVTFRLEPNHWLGIVGASGSGKSTLVDLLMGLLEPGHGTVRMNGQRLHSRPARGRVSYVPQNAFIARTTLLGNLVPGVPLADIDRGRARDCLNLVQLAELIRSLPLGMDTPIGQAGAGLSSGQRQRLALARGLYHTPALLVLDEATAALDPCTEESILARIRQLPEPPTIVMVSHRMAAVRHCDSILVLSGGRMVDRGNFGQLLARCPEFRRMADAAGDDGVRAPVRMAPDLAFRAAGR